LKTAKTFPQGLKASSFCTIDVGTTEVVPFQNASSVWCVCPALLKIVPMPGGPLLL
jgi:hypothetical protein